MFCNQLFDIELACFVGARYDPQAALRGGIIKLNLKIKTMDTFVPFWRVPVGYAILMPGNRATDTWLLNENCIIVWDKIVAVD